MPPKAPAITVAMLIEALQKLPADTEVWCQQTSNQPPFPIKEIKSKVLDKSVPTKGWLKLNGFKGQSLY